MRTAEKTGARTGKRQEMRLVTKHGGIYRCQRKPSGQEAIKSQRQGSARDKNAEEENQTELCTQSSKRLPFRQVLCPALPYGSIPTSVPAVVSRLSLLMRSWTVTAPSLYPLCGICCQPVCVLLSWLVPTLRRARCAGVERSCKQRQRRQRGGGWPKSSQLG